MMVGEHEQPVVVEHAVAFGKHRPQLGREAFGIDVLNLSRPAR